MIYWVIVGTLWIISIVSLIFSGFFLCSYLQTKSSQYLLGGALGGLMGVILNFLVVNWPTGGTVVKKALDEQTLKALKVMAKTATIAPKAVKEGLEKILEKYSAG